MIPHSSAKPGVSPIATIPIRKLKSPKKDSSAPSSLNRFKEIIYAVKISDKRLSAPVYPHKFNITKILPKLN